MPLSCRGGTCSVMAGMSVKMGPSATRGRGGLAMPPLPRVRIRLKPIAPAQRRMRWRTASASSRCKRPMRKRYRLKLTHRARP